ncbi:MAG: 50S ribosomal protein L29 [Thermoleophilia bacterium]|nr:50S ribosomal protein L29 [Thermoleophilia bacterium]
MSLTTIELSKKSEADLVALVITNRQELLDLRFSHSTGALENSARLGQVKRDIARIKTALNKRQAAASATKVTTS